MTMGPYAPRTARYFATFGDDGVPTAFYHEAAHGHRTLQVQRHVESSDIREFPRVEFDEAPNPDCLIPRDAVPISEQDWARWVGADKIEEA